jgi:glycosyltransferase involved in cell wall biosynthesis
MKLLVLAQPPPPVHGQSLMVRTLLDGLPSVAPEIELVHVNPRLSRDTGDVGRWRAGKIVSLLAACLRALRLRLRHGPMQLYYVPAPGKRAALYRDWLVMLLCRPCCSGLVLHWHAVGLGEWLSTHATAPERAITRALLGRAGLAIVLSPALAGDARVLAPRRVAIAPNGLADPLAGAALPAREPIAASAPLEILFLGLGSREKGLFAAVDAVALAHRRAPGGCRLTVAGGFASEADAAAFRARATELGPGLVRHAGFADETQKHALLAAADVFCLPTSYPHEGQPLALIEALAHDLPVVTTRWRAIPELLPAGSPQVFFVDPRDPATLADAFAAARRAGRPGGRHRAHFLAHFTREAHLAALAAALRQAAPLSATRPTARATPAPARR